MDNLEYIDKLIKGYELEIHEALLDDIGFNMYQIDELRELYQKHAFNGIKHIFEEIILNIKQQLKTQKEEYERKYHCKPNLKDARGVFSRNRANVNEKRERTRDPYKEYPVPQQQTLGFQAWGSDDNCGENK